MKRLLGYAGVSGLILLGIVLAFCLGFTTLAMVDKYVGYSKTDYIDQVGSYSVARSLHWDAITIPREFPGLHEWVVDVHWQGGDTYQYLFDTPAEADAWYSRLVRYHSLSPYFVEYQK